MDDIFKVHISSIQTKSCIKQIISIQAPQSAARIDIFHFIQQIIFD